MNHVRLDHLPNIYHQCPLGNPCARRFYRRFFVGCTIVQVKVIVRGCLHVRIPIRFPIRIPVRFGAHPIFRMIRIGAFLTFKIGHNLIFACIFREMSFLPSFGSSAPIRRRIRMGIRTGIRTQYCIACRDLFSYCTKN
jgi:hypothetical protein